MILQEMFFRRFGVRRPEQLISPVVHTLDKFEFPRNSLWNYNQYDDVAIGPDSNEYFLRNITKRVAVQHFTELTSFIGNPRRMTVPLQPVIRKFHLQHRRFRLSQDITSDPTDHMTLAMSNYCLLAKGYKYPRSVFAKYYKWANTEASLWNQVKIQATKSVRNQYYFTKLPKTLPSVARLNQGTRKFNQTLLNLFSEKEALFILEMWKWLSLDNRENSLIPVMKQEELDKINIVFEDNGSWILFNLGVLESWRDDGKDSKQKVKIKPEKMQKMFLRGLMNLMSFRAGEEPETDDLTKAEPEETSSLTETLDATDLNKHQEIEALLENLDKDLDQLEVIELQAEDLVKAQNTDITENTLTEIDPREAKTKEFLDSFKDKPSTKKKVINNIARDLPDTDVMVDLFESNTDLLESLKEKINIQADDGLISGSEYRKKINQVEKFSNLGSPVAGVKLADFIKVDPKALEINPALDDITLKDKELIKDKSMLQSSLLEFDKRYVREVMKKDTMNMAVSTQKAGFVITDYEVEDFEDAIGKFESHTIRVAPVEGIPSTLRFKLPVVDEQGQFQVGGTKYILRKQRSDVPIRKISPTRVSLSSYYGKTFITRSERKANNYALWLHDKISALTFADDSGVSDIHPSNVFDYKFKAPKTYSSIAQNIKSFKAHGFELIFDHKEREGIFGEELIKAYEVKGAVLFGIRPDGAVLLMDKNSTIYQILNDELEPIGAIEDFLNIDSMQAPVEYAEARIFGKNIPVAIVLGYKLGLTNLLEKLKLETRLVGAGQRLNLQKHEASIAFSDETLIYSREDPLASLIISGFKPYEKTTKNYSIYTFDKTGVYLKLLEQTNMGVRYLKEINLLDEMFVDPITEEILKQMNEPLTYRGLVIRACELLTTDYHKDPLDMQEMRIKGYERMSGAVYAEIVNAVREHRAKLSKKDSQIELNPYAVWKRVVEDPSKLPVNELNPIENLKQIEAVTYGGTGGRTSRAMVKGSRAFHPNDAGVISEATSDSSDVAINTYLTANPNFKNLRGLIEVKPIEDIPPASLVSTSALLSVGADQDSAQRLNMVSIQQSHSIACNGYKPSAVRTGYEHIVAERVSNTFAATAKGDGVITDISVDTVKVKYKDGTEEAFEIGRKFGKSGDLTIPHKLITDYQKGQKFTKGDVLVYNKDFFERDNINPSSVIWKNSLTVRVALLESRQTHEDANSISRELAEKLTTSTTKIKNVVVNFDQHVRNILAVGEKVDNDTALCLIEDSVTSGSQLFDDDSLNTLKKLSSQAPTAKVKGVIEKIEVLYYGDLEDMTPSLQELASKSDRQMRSQARNQGKKVVNGQIDESFRIEGEPLQYDSLVIRFYITSDVVSTLGDKLVFANQLKSIISEVMDYEVKTESGLKIDAVFGAQSIFNRIVNSAFVIGTTNTLLEVIGKKAAKIYKGEK